MTVVLPKPRLIAFDLDNTLYSHTHCNERALAKTLRFLSSKCCIDAETVSDAFLNARKRVKKQIGSAAASHSRLLFFQHTLEILGHDAFLEDALTAEEIFWDEFILSMELAEGVLDVLQTIQTNLIPTALVTDLTAQIQIKKLLRLEIAEAFDIFISSEECSGEKDTGAPYDILLAKTNEKVGSHIWMIGDSARDISAKQYLSATTLHARMYVSENIQNADAAFSNFSELDKMISKALSAE